VRFERGTDAASIVLPDTPDVRALRAEQLWARNERKPDVVLSPCSPKSLKKADPHDYWCLGCSAVQSNCDTCNNGSNYVEGKSD